MNVPLRKVSWPDLLKQLELEPTKQQLPVAITCPACQARDALWIYTDKTDVAWTSCRHCDMAGDLVELASSVWKIPVESVLPELASRGMDISPADWTEEALAPYLAKLTARGKLNELWRYMQDNVTKRPTDLGEAISRRLNIHYADQPSHSRFANLYGLATIGDFHNSIREIFQKIPKLDLPLTRFKRKLRDDALFVPFFDLPGRICGFLVASGLDSSERQLAYWPVYGDKSADAGVSSIHVLTQSIPPRFGNRAFVCEDPLLALTMQIRHLKEYDDPLPIVGAWLEGKIVTRGEVLRSLPRTYTFVAANSITPRVIQLAKTVDGTVTQMKRRDESGGQIEGTEVRRRPSHHWCERFVRLAKPWPKFLHDYLPKLSVDDAVVMLDRCQLSADDRDVVLEGLPAEVRTNLRERTSPSVAPCGVVINGREIVESVRGWALRDRDELIVNAKLRIDEVVYQSNTQQTLYRGRILFGDSVINFLELADKIDANAFTWMRSRLLREPHVTDVLTFNRRWSSHAVTIAQAFAKPTKRIVDGRLGWSEETQEFIFPQFVIRRGGELRLQDKSILGIESPAGSHLRPPDQLEAPGLSLLLDVSEENRLFWSVFLAIARNVVGAVQGSKPRPIAITGVGANSARICAEALGCTTTKLTSNSYQACLAKMELAAAGTSWPTFFDGRANKTAMLQFLSTDSTKNCFLPMDDLLVNAANLCSNWTVIDAVDQAGGISSLVGHVDQILAYYVVDVLRRGGVKVEAAPKGGGLINNISGDFGYRLRLDVQAWVKSQVGQQSGSLEKERLYLRLMPSRALCISNIVHRLQHAGALKIGRVGFGDNASMDVLRYAEGDEDYMLIKQASLLAAMRKQDLPTPATVDEMRALLQQQRHYNECSEEFRHGTRWWRIDRSERIQMPKKPRVHESAKPVE